MEFYNWAGLRSITTVQLGLFLPKNIPGISGPPLTLESILADRACAPTAEMFAFIYILIIYYQCT